MSTLALFSVAMPVSTTDEPTGALDSQTSIQVMDLLREVAEDRLVVIVTHNPQLAEQYATRIVAGVVPTSL